MESRSPKISIIIPIYKVKQYLDQCFTSILKQTYTDYEVIMVDDGSPDASVEVCLKYQNKDPRFRYFRKTNGGAASARNFGIDVARGQYFAFVDSDDCLNDGYLSSLIKQIEENHSDIATISYYMINEEGRFFVPLNPNADDESLNGTYTPEQWIKTFFNRDGMIYTAPWSKLFKREIFTGIKFPENISAGDDQFTMWRAYMNAKTISFKNDQQYRYLLNSKSLSKVDVTAYLNGVLALEEQMATFVSMGLDTSYMISLYTKRLQGLYDNATKNGDFNLAEQTKYKLDKINNK